MIQTKEEFGWLDNFLENEIGKSNLDHNCSYSSFNYSDSLDRECKRQRSLNLDVDAIWEEAFIYFDTSEDDEEEDKIKDERQVKSEEYNDDIDHNLSNFTYDDNIESINQDKLTEQHRIISVGIIFLIFILTGTTSLGSKGSLINWKDASLLLDNALIRYGYRPLKKSSESMQYTFKNIKCVARREGQTLFDMFNEFITKYNHNDKLCSIRNDIQPLLSTYNKIGDISFFKTGSPIFATRKNAWTHLQELILYGSIVNFVFEHGSLTRTNTVPYPWNIIKQKFDTFVKIQHNMNNEIIPIRHAPALKRHYKKMRTRLSDNPRYFVDLYSEFHIKFKDNFSIGNIFHNDKEC